MSALVAAVVGYLLGSLQSGLIVGRVYRGVDVRDYGSGKTGFTNTLRMFGLGAALIVVSLDIAKGALPVLLGRFVFDDPLAATLGGIAAVAGHIWPAFSGFRGGRGVATSFGGFLAMAPLWALALLALGGLVLAVTRYVSVMSMSSVIIGLVMVGMLVAAGQLDPWYALYGIAVALAVELSHLGNLRRLLRGTEPKIGHGGVPRAPGAA